MTEAVVGKVIVLKPRRKPEISVKSKGAIRDYNRKAPWRERNNERVKPLRAPTIKKIEPEINS